MSMHAVTLARFLAVFALLLGGLHWYVWRRLVVDPEWPAPARRGAGIIYLSLIAVFLYGGMGGRFVAACPTWIRWTANIWLGLLGLLACVLFTADFARLAGRLATRGRPPASPERRRFLARLLAGGSAAVSAAIGGAAIFEATRRVRTKSIEITLDKLDKQHDGYRIVQITDVHVGPTLRKDFVEEVVDGVVAAKPDLVAITGDLVDGNVAELGPLLEPLRRLAPRDGVFFCTGNHEYYSGHRQWLAYLPKLGIRPLQNERVRLAAFELAGVPDWTAKDFDGAEPADVPNAVAGRDPSLPLLLLAHQPRHAYDAMGAEVDLQLSGHTHGGQMFPVTVLIHLAYPFIAGHYRRGPFQIYVSQGTGYWGPPMRLGTEAEITSITLRAKA